MSLFRNLLMELKEEPKYTLLDYIESTGTQYIDTGISGNEYGAYEIEMNTLATKANNWEQYFGGDTMPRNEMPKIYYDKNLVKVIIQGGNMSGNNVIIDTYNNTTIIHAFSLADIKHKIAINGSSVYIDDNYIADNRNCVWGNLTFTIFKNHEEGLNASMKLYSLKMWSNNVLVRNYIPVLDENNVACLYDLVSKTFFYNQGTGTFNYGLL